MYHFEKLIVWQKAIELAKLIYRDIHKLPRQETYCLTKQLQRSCTSVAINIAEGSSSNRGNEFRRYMRIARASLQEIVAILKIFEAVHNINIEKYLALCEVVGKLINGLLKYLNYNSTKTSNK